MRKHSSNSWSELIDKKIILPDNNEMTQLFNIFVSNIQEKEIGDEIENLDLTSLKNNILNDISELNIKEHQMEIEDINIYAIRNYFLRKAVTRSFIHSDLIINTDFCEETKLLNFNDYQLIDVLCSNEYLDFFKLWKVIISNINDFEIVHYSIGSNYKLVSSFQRDLQNLFNLYCNKYIITTNQITDISKIKADFNYNGPDFTERMLSILFSENGKEKEIPLNCLHLWKSKVCEIYEVCWSNLYLQHSDYDISMSSYVKSIENSQKILSEITFAQSNCNLSVDNELTLYFKCFQELVFKLTTNINKTSENHHETLFLTSLNNVLIGSLELCLTNITSLIDPVEKNRIKKEYIFEDIDILNDLHSSYKLFQTIMNFNGLGQELDQEISKQIEVLEDKKQKYDKKLAIRPKECLYGAVTEEIRYFLTSNGNPKNLLSLIDLVESKYKALHENEKCPEISDLNKRLDLWITNSQMFLHQLTTKYASYYKDLTRPVECALNTICFEFQRLKYVIQEIYFSNLKHIDTHFQEFINNLIQFPSTNILKVDNIFQVRNMFKTISSNEELYLKLLKVKIIEIRNLISLTGVIDQSVFNDLKFVFKILNELWKNEEQKKMEVQKENESLYTTM